MKDKAFQFDRQQIFKDKPYIRNSRLSQYTLFSKNDVRVLINHLLLRSKIKLFSDLRHTHI